MERTLILLDLDTQLFTGTIPSPQSSLPRPDDFSQKKQISFPFWAVFVDAVFEYCRIAYDLDLAP
ncbi:hypothetical protein HK096_006147, partial [Nowakowskiella sp. JEL0078]